MGKITGYLIGFACLFTLPCFSQVTQDNLMKQMTKAGCLFHSYEFDDINDTPPPAGFKPFYISHYGRHGSRYHTLEKFFAESYLTLEKARLAGNLTAEGEYLLKQTDSLYRLHDGMLGVLTPKGAVEQKTLAKRMCGRFPEVFAGKGVRQIESYSSDIPRCILSLAAFTGTILSQYPGIDVSYESGERCSRYLRITDTYAPSKEYYYPLMHEAIEKSCDWSSVMEKLFVDPSLAEISPYGLASHIWGAWAICECVEDVHIDIMKYFTKEQLFNTWKLRSQYYYQILARSDKFGEASAEGTAVLLKDFLEKADKAIASDNTAATLRFGHDSILMPLMALVGIDEFDDRHSEQDPIVAKWDLGTFVCMASNVQMVFYKNRAGQILVKILYNEKETTIPAISPFRDCYYEWDVLRAYLDRKITAAAPAGSGL